MTTLEGKVTLTTGAARGIGAACVEAFARSGASVVIADVLDSEGEAVARAIGGKACYVHLDVANEEDWCRAMSLVKTNFGRLDVLVNNAGISMARPDIAAMTLAEFRRIQAVNVDGVFLGIKHGLTLMRESGRGGSIINVASVGALKGAPGMAAYAASKGAVRMLSKSVALECTRAKDGIRVNAVFPGLVATHIYDGLLPGNPAPDFDALAASMIPMGSAGQPEDIASGVLWLASDSSRYVTGSELVIDGGFTS